MCVWGGGGGIQRKPYQMTQHATLRRPMRWSYAFVALLHPFYIKSEVQLVYVQLDVKIQRKGTAMLQLAIMNYRLIMLDYEFQVRRRRRPKGFGSVHVYPQTDGYNLGTMTK